MIRDLRRYARHTTTRLVVGSLLLVFILGDGLIYILYGPRPALLGLICLVGAMVPPLLVVIILWGMEWIVRNANRE